MSTMSWTETDVPDQTGRTVVITGANSGLGLENARALAAKRAHVVMAARNMEKAGDAERTIKALHPEASLEVRHLDLASLQSVAESAAGVTADHDRLDLLIDNAGVMAIPEARTSDGFEMQFGVNHLGHHALTARLLPLLMATPGSRVITVTSTGRHFGGPVDPENPHLEGNYSPWRAYGQSKLANLHFAVGLDRKLRAADAPTRALVAHPGLATTDLQVNTTRQGGGDASERYAATFGMTPADGALPQLRAATDPNASGGELYAPRWVNWGPPVRRPLFGRSTDPDAIATLFAVSDRETGLSIDAAISGG
jgi:NAD(P)-dependent dehydrogenase (short-subunit alcohol dehydrogenase family)